MLEDDKGLVRGKPALVVSLDAIFGSKDGQGCDTESPDVVDLIRHYSGEGFYILIDSGLALLKAVELLTAYDVPYNGLVRDRPGVYTDAQRYYMRVAEHIGWHNVHGVIDEDIFRLAIATEDHNVSAYQVVAGHIISQRSRGKGAYIPATYGHSFKAGVTINVY